MRQRGDISGDRALHVVGAAPDQQAVQDLSGERVAVPSFPRRHDVEMAGEAEVRRALAADRHHVLGRAVGGLAQHPPVDGEAERSERAFEQVEHFASSGRDAGNADQLCGKSDGIDRGGHLRLPTSPPLADKPRAFTERVLPK